MNDSKNEPKKPRQGKTNPRKAGVDSDFAKVVKIMADTPPISNDEIVKRKKK